eukprot:m.64376 g.64376  ORF g.64376 m.64376 type:complete len:673 (-) comp13999_c0_seq1:77-2095(-)
MQARVESLTDKPWRALLEGHDDWVHTLAWSASGIATAAADGSVVIFDPITTQVLETLNSSGPIFCVEWAKDLGTIALGTAHGAIEIWTTHQQAEKPDQLFEGHTQAVRCLQYDAHGQLLATGSDDGDLRLWRSDSGICSVVMPLGAAIECLQWSPEVRTVLACGLQDGVVVIVNAKTRSHNPLTTRSAAVLSLAWNKAGSQLALGLQSGSVDVVDLQGQTIMQVHDAHSDWVVTVAWNRYNNLIASAGFEKDKTVKVWDLNSQSCAGSLHGHLAGVTDLAFSLDGTELATTSADTTVRVWDLTKLRRQSKTDTIEDGHEESCRSVRFSHDGHLLATASDDCTLRVWNPKTSSRVRTYRDQTDWTTCIAWSPDDEHLCCSSGDGNIRIYSLEQDEPIQVLTGHTDWVESVDWSPGGQLIASCGFEKDPTVRLWDVSSGSNIHTLLGHAGRVVHVEFHPDGELLASSGADGTIRLWNVADGRQTTLLDPKGGAVNEARFSPNGELLATASEDNSLRVWSVKDGIQQQVFTPHSRNVVCLAWAEHESLLLSGSDDFTVAVIPLDESIAPTSFQLDTPVYSLDWTDGSGAVCGCASGRIVQLSVLLDRDRRASLAWSKSFRRTRKDLAVGSEVQHLMEEDPMSLSGASMKGNFMVHQAVVVDPPKPTVRSSMCSVL